MQLVTYINTSINMILYLYLLSRYSLITSSLTCVVCFFLILTSQKWESGKNFLMFLYMLRYRGMAEQPPPASTSLRHQQQHMNHVFSIYDLTR